MIKVLERVELERTHTNTIKGVYDNPTANIILNAEKLEAISLKSGARQNCLVYKLLFNTLLEALPLKRRK